MSAFTEEDFQLKLDLFESAVPHAWVSWDEFGTVQVEKSACPDILPVGEYKLQNLVKGNNLTQLQEYHTGISEETARFEFSIQNNGIACDVKCASLKKHEKIMSLWSVQPEKDSSIFYLQNAAHDFRSPLASILGVVNLMHHSIKNDSELDREEFTILLDMIKVNTDKTLRLADEIMELAEIESDDYQLKITPVVMKDFVENYLATHRLLTLKKRIKVHFEANTTATVLINESKLTRALDNILSNAVKFSSIGSEIRFRLEEHKENIRLTIADQGIGMSEEILKNVFVKFGSSKRNGLDGEPSHGLGMSIVQQIMKLHRGQVEITSKEGSGTQVSLILNKKQ
ncbi:MAG: HAMP domain-containing sensor histidine kinase [Ekhidna sp.]|uniref:sensor histidine kinase n=1 Tax=Ekhidna sp. TaxID=2608089 RepID=UPI0032EAA207